MSTPNATPAEQTPVKNGKRRRALTILAIVVVLAGIGWLL